MADKFNLAALLAEVSEPGTGREQIEYIPLTQIDSDPNNFYQLTEIEELAANISLCGLQQPIRVRQQEDGRYMIVSGHRRRAALEILSADDPKYQEAPCIVEQDDVSPSLQQLRLIYANASTRKLSSAEISEQAVQVEKLLYQLKEEGYEFPGRMRDHVAQAVSVSKTKLARLKVIRENLAGCWQAAWQSGKLGESSAYALAQNPAKWQQTIFVAHGDKPHMLYEESVKEYARRFSRLSDIECPHGCCTGCDNMEKMMLLSVKDRWIDPCRSGCCRTCVYLTTCKNSCVHAAALKTEKKRTAKDAAKAAADDQAKRDAPKIDLIRKVYARVGSLRAERKVSVQRLFEAQCQIYAATDDRKQESLEDGTANITALTTLPFGYSFYVSTAITMTRVADALGCSIDYLLGRTDCPDLSVEKVPEPGTGWKTGNPEEAGTYVLILARNKYVGPKAEIWNWNGEEWTDCGVPYDKDLDGKIFGWCPMLDMTEAQYD